jgi:hypothetical protein
MNMKFMNNQVTEYIENAPIDQKEILVLVRNIIHQSVNDVIEDFKWNRPIFKTNKDFAYFLVNKKYVTIGFTKNIEKINDTNQLLEGTGKTMRHIKLKKVGDINRDQLTEWFKSIAS